jgi:hypothetical protein
MLRTQESELAMQALPQTDERAAHARDPKAEQEMRRSRSRQKGNGAGAQETLFFFKAGHAFGN